MLEALLIFAAPLFAIVVIPGVLFSCHNPINRFNNRIYRKLHKKYYSRD